MSPQTYRDGTGAEHSELPKLNVALLETAIKWASRSRSGRKKEYEPAWHQGTWGERFWSLITVQGRNEKGQWTQKQEVPYCDTNYCLAGYALEMTDNLDWKPGWEVLQVYPGSDFGRRRVASTEPMIKEEFVPYSGDIVDNSDHHLCFSDAGALALGLTDNEALMLFAGGNKLGYVKDLARRIAESRNEHIEI